MYLRRGAHFVLALIGCCALLPLSAAGSLGAARATSISGWMAVLWSDSPGGRTVFDDPQYRLTADDGRTYRLVPAAEVDPSGVPWWQLGGQRVTVEGVRLTAADAVRITGAVPERGSVLRATAITPVAPTRAAAASGEQRWLSILCKFADIDTEPRAPSYFDDSYGSTYPRLGHYWQEQSYGTFTVSGEAVGWYTLPHPRTTYVLDTDGDGEEDYLDNDRAAQDCTAAADADVFFPDYDGLSLAFNADLAHYSLGGTHWLTLDGVGKLWRMTWLADWGYMNLGVTAHEMGHALGLPHSVGSGPGVFDNVWDVMSFIHGAFDPTFGRLGQHTIAFHKDYLGWIPVEQKLSVGWGTTTTVTLDRLAQPAGGGYLLARIPIQGSLTSFYTVEVRDPVGYDANVPGPAVIIHEVDVERKEPAQLVVGEGDVAGAGGMWIVGETFEDARNGVTVAIVARSGTGFAVTITVVPEPDFATCADQTQIPEAECAALVALYDATEGPSWTSSSGWLASGAVCSWDGVTCSGGHVVRLDLHRNNLHGALPAQLGDLTHVTNLDLHDNQLTGPIPPQLGDLVNLDTLLLHDNQLSGAIPSALGFLDDLYYLDLHDNQLTGSIPPQLGFLLHLSYLYLGQNELCGGIPSELGALASLRTLSAHTNQLTGPIPPELGDLERLRTLNLHTNHLTGPIPVELARLANLHTLSLDVNRLGGSIPTELGALTALTRLGLFANQLGGEVPPSLANLETLSLLDLGLNMLTASDPALVAFLNERDPDWAETQTIPPGGLTAIAESAERIALSWTAIPYAANPGGYEYAGGANEEGPYTVLGTTANKTVTSALVEGLEPETTYYFVVRTFSAATGLQQNDLRSPYSPAASATTGDGSASATATSAGTLTATGTTTPTRTATGTATPTATSTSTGTATPSATSTPTNTATLTPTVTSTASAPPSMSASATVTATTTPTPSVTPSPASSATLEPSASATPGSTASNTPIAAASQTETATATHTSSATVSSTATTTDAHTPTDSPSPTPTGTATGSATCTPGSTDTATPSPTATPTPATSPTATDTATPDVSPSPSATTSPSPTAGSSVTPSPTATATPTPNGPSTPSPPPEPTPTPRSTASANCTSVASATASTVALPSAETPTARLYVPYVARSASPVQRAPERRD